MALDNIQQAVLESARTQAEHILQRAQRAADEKVSAFQEAETQAAEKRYQAAVRAIDDEYARTEIQAAGVHNKKLLEKRNALLAAVFAQAREQLLGLPRDAYARLMRRLLEAAAGVRGGRVRVAREDEAVFAELVAALNAGRAADATLTLDMANPLVERGGFILVSGGYEVDQTIGTLLADLERTLTPQIAAELFAG